MTQADSESSTAMPAGPAGALYRRTDISPEQFFETLGRVRRAARDEIERLIEWLDSTIDCDQDAAIDDGPIDDTELEPSLGSFDRMSDQIKAWSSHQFHAEGTDRELDAVDDEPTLASPEQHPTAPYTTTGYTGGIVVYGPAGRYRDGSGSQHQWAGGNRTDLEEQCDDEGSAA